MIKEIQLDNQEKYMKASSFIFDYSKSNNGSSEIKENKTIYSFPRQCEVLEFPKSRKFMMVGSDEDLINKLEEELGKFCLSQEIGEIVKEGVKIINGDSELIEKLRE